MRDVSRELEYMDDDLVKSVFEHTLTERLYRRAGDNTCSLHDLLSRHQKWQEEGSVTVFTAGVFDILHTSHLLALTHYRLIGAHEYLKRQGWTVSPPNELHAVAASDNVRLILSVDTDRRVTQDKSFVESKGNSPKPLVSWKNRALLLARQHISSDSGTHILVDYITSHGPDACTCNDCPHSDNAYIAAEIKPDIVVVSGGSPETVQKLHAAEGLGEATQLVIIKEDKIAYHDTVLGGPIKTSAIVKRARMTPQGYTLNKK